MDDRPIGFRLGVGHNANLVAALGRRHPAWINGRGGWATAGLQHGRVINTTARDRPSE